MAVSKGRPVTYDKFTGKNNVSPAERLKRDELRTSTNIDIDAENRISRRKGFSQALAGSDCHSLWSNDDIALFVDGSDLKQFNEDETATTLRSNLQPGNPMAYVDVIGSVYYSDGQVTGVVRDGENYPNGIDVPSAPALASTAGTLRPGSYQVAVTLVDTDGRESGASGTSLITLNSAGGIRVALPYSARPHIEAVNVYCSPADGDKLYFAQQATNGTSSLTVTGLQSAVPLRTQFIEPPPAGHLLAYLGGRLYVAVDNLVFYSDPYATEHFRLGDNFIPFPQKVTLLGAVDDGLFVSSDKTYFLPGVDPEQQALITKSKAKAVAGTMATVDWVDVGDGGESSGEALMWMSDQGVMLGGAGGVLQNVTRKTLRVPAANEGAGIVRQQNGMSQYLGLVKDTSDDREGMYVGDTAVSEVIRNGVSI